MIPEVIISSSALRCLHIRPVFHHIIVPNFIWNTGVELFISTSLRISTSIILRPESMQGEIILPIVFWSSASRVSGLAKTKFSLPRICFIFICLMKAKKLELTH
jgi:hypothetical protein